MIIIAGTHRSGSSYVAGLLHDCGLPLGPSADFLPADPANPLGYFEQRAVVDLNSRIITGFRRMQSPLEGLVCRAVYATRPGPEAIARRAARRVDEMRALGERFDRTIIKDPRFSLTYPHWTPLARFHGMVVVMRHPEASARSMHRRDRIPRGVAYRFWDYHVEGLLRWLPAERTLFVDFDRLAGPDSDEELRRLHVYFAPAVPEAEFVRRGRAMFADELRHWAPRSEGDLPARTQALWTRVTAMAADHRARFSQGERLRPEAW